MESQIVQLWVLSHRVWNAYNRKVLFAKRRFVIGFVAVEILYDYPSLSDVQEVVSYLHIGWPILK